MPEKKTLTQRVSRLERLAKSALVSDNIKAIIEDYLWTIEEVLCDAEELVRKESKLERLQ